MMMRERRRAHRASFGLASRNKRMTHHGARAPMESVGEGVWNGRWDEKPAAAAVRMADARERRIIDLVVFRAPVETWQSSTRFGSDTHLRMAAAHNASFVGPGHIVLFARVLRGTIH